MTDPLKDHFVRTVPRGSELPERGVYLGDVFVLTTADGGGIIHEWDGQRWFAPLNIEGWSAPINIEAIRRLVAHRDTNTGRGHDHFSRERDDLMAKVAALATKVEERDELLSALIRQIELGSYTDAHGHKLTNNVHFIEAKEAVGE